MKFHQGQLTPELLPPRQLHLDNYPLDNFPRTITSGLLAKTHDIEKQNKLIKEKYLNN